MTERVTYDVTRASRKAFARRPRLTGRLAVSASLLWLGTASPVEAQQVADSAFRPPIPSPAYPAGAGPLVLIDEAHQNFHTANGRYAPFADLVRRDGYTVESLRAPFSASTLEPAAVLVIANAVGLPNARQWVRPIVPAFTPAEIAAVRRWVEGGGSLLLIADHMPFAGAAAELGRIFGLEFSDGFAMPAGGQSGTIVFARRDSALADHPIVNGRSAGERVDSVASFTGQGFRVVAGAVQPLMRLPADIQLLEPDTAWVFDSLTKRRTGSGWLQGATLLVGRGRVVVLGEAAMFSAQLAGAQRIPVGMNAPMAGQNAQFLLNTMHWLTGLLDS